MIPIIALDFPSKKEVETFLAPFQGQSLFVKVGIELFYKEGPSIVHYLQEQGHQIFLDLKLHDIPNTVERAMENLGQLGIQMTTLHAAGGTKMMDAAKRGLEKGAKKAGVRPPLLVAITELTSTSQEQMNEEEQVLGRLQDHVLHYASLVESVGLDGVVCSGWEAESIHAHCPKLCTVCPGIRFQPTNDDQVRVLTPIEAKEKGIEYIVVGRPITQTKDPQQAYQNILEA